MSDSIGTSVVSAVTAVVRSDTGNTVLALRFSSVPLSPVMVAFLKERTLKGWSAEPVGMRSVILDTLNSSVPVKHAKYKDDLYG